MCPESSERSGSLAAVYRMIKKKDGTTAIRITKETATAEANKMAAARSGGSPRNNKQSKQSAGSSSYKDKKK